MKNNKKILGKSITVAQNITLHVENVKKGFEGKFCVGLANEEKSQGLRVPQHYL